MATQTETNIGELERIDSNGKSTEQLVGEILVIFNRGNRATCLCASGTGKDVIQRIRMKLSRVRNSMEKKSIPKQHFNLSAACYPYTNGRGVRMDCLVFRKVVRADHLVHQTLERIAIDALTGGNAEKQKQPAGFQW